MNYQDYVEIDPKYFRPAEVDQLLGDPSKAKEKLGWEPKTTIDKLINMMTDHYFDLARKEYVIDIYDKRLK